MNREFDVLIIGAGIVGLSTAFHLSQKNLRIGVLEQFCLGHSLGSSHGESRITRSIYTDRRYFRLIQRVRSEEWPLLETAAGQRLIHSTPGCFIGNEDIFSGFLKLASAAQLPIRQLDPADARKRFPHFIFEENSAVLFDETAGVIAARQSLEALARLALERQVAICENTKVIAIEPTSKAIRILTEAGIFTAERVIAAAGPWMPRLIPAISELATPVRQTVGYFQLKGDVRSYRVGRFPVWAHIGSESIHYGLPEFGSPGIKIAEHLTQGAGDDPNETQLPSLSKTDKLIEFVKAHFAQPIERIIKFETCMYTVATKERFILDTLPQEPRIVAASCCSGHAFKFAPLLGKIASELALHGKTQIGEFEDARDLFSIEELAAK